MLVVYLLISLLLYTGNGFKIPISRPYYNDKLIKCTTDIVRKYFSENGVVTYVGNKVEDAELLQTINTVGNVTVISRGPSHKIPIPHEAYLISVKNATVFAEHFPFVTKESTWNPSALFLIIVRALKENHLRIIFDTALRLHAINVVVMNATEEADLYTYNPFDNYSCGKRYKNVVSYGKCLDAHSINLYADKFVTGLQNCTFNVLIPQWPPYTIITTDYSEKSSPFQYGAETYLFKIMGEMEGFKINIIKNYGDAEEFPTVSTDMEAMGSLKRVQDNEVDIVLGGMLLTPSRSAAFTCIFGHLAYTDEIRFVVKRASIVPPWKNLYLEFQWTVWGLLMLAFMIYSTLIIILLRTKDKSNVVLILLDGLVLHGHNMRCRWTVKCVLIIWVWFAYLVNTFYLSSLVSLSTNPAQEYQISKEEDIAKYQLKPCFSSIMGKYYIESVQSGDRYHRIDGCYSLIDSVKTVIKSKDVYAIILNGLYQYYDQEFFDEYGNSLVTLLPKPYSKVLYSIYMYKGFPMSHGLIYKALRLRENGVVEKVMSDMNYLKQIKHRFRKSEFRGRFSIPWLLYIAGCLVAITTFCMEVISKCLK